jgi:cyanophycin synthetase
VVLEEGINGHMITLYDKGALTPLLWTHLIPATIEGKALHNVQNALFAAAMAYAMGVRIENIRQGLRTFDNSYFQVPGRTNIFNDLPFKVVVDYGHNAPAVQALVDLVQKLECSGRRICVVAGPGDRRDEDIRNIARAVARAPFDHVIVRRDDDPRGRAPDEVPRLLHDEMVASGFPKEKIQMIAEEPAAIDAALRMARRGDLVLLFADKVSRSWKQVIYFKPETPGSERPPPPAPSASNVAIPLARGSSLSVGEVLLEGATVIQDERGVRIAREDGD